MVIKIAGLDFESLIASSAAVEKAKHFMDDITWGTGKLKDYINDVTLKAESGSVVVEVTGQTASQLKSWLDAAVETVKTKVVTDFGNDPVIKQIAGDKQISAGVTVESVPQVKLTITISGLDYDTLIASPAAVQAVKDIIKAFPWGTGKDGTGLGTLGDYITDIKIKPGSVVVELTMKAVDGQTAEEAKSWVDAAVDTVKTKVTTDLGNNSVIKAIATGQISVSVTAASTHDTETSGAAGLSLCAGMLPLVAVTVLA